MMERLFGSVPVNTSSSKMGVVAFLLASSCSAQVGKLGDGGMCWLVPCFKV